MVQATGVILAGGRSVRMGTDKAVLKVGRRLMIQRVAGELRKVFPEVLISGSDPALGRSLGLPVVADRIDKRVPLCGIHAALEAARYEYILVAACDMPFLTAELARRMVGLAAGFDVTVPKHGAYLQPLFAVYRRSCLAVIERNLDAGKYKIDEIYSQVRVNYVDLARDQGQEVDVDAIFFNVNTPVDLLKAREMAGPEEVTNKLEAR